MRAAVAAALAAAACGAPATPASAPIANVAPPAETPAVIDTEVRPPVAEDLPRYAATIPGDGPLSAEIVTSLGPIRCALAADTAPMTVANFIGLATGAKAWRDPATGQVRVGEPFYDGLTFHRVIPDFMIQGGDRLGDGSGDPGYEFGEEIDPARGFVPGALAMANAGLGTNGSQFFIMDGTASHLDGKFTVFGQCEPVDVVAAIARVPRDSRDAPIEPVVIRTITIGR